MIKLIATDMDGTLLKSNGSLPEDFYKIHEKLVKKGIIFTIASGRQYHTLLNNFNEIRNDITVIAENGAIIIHKGKEIFTKSISREDAINIIKDVKAVEGCDAVICGKNYAYVEAKNAEFAKEVCKYYHNCKVIDDLYQYEEDEVMKIAVFDYENAERCKKILAPQWENQFKLVVSGKNWMDFGRLDVDKGVALEYIQDYFSIDSSETLVFGDYYNDVPMFNRAMHSFAMENAPDGVKRKARFIAPDNNKEGVIIKIKELAI